MCGRCRCTLRPEDIPRACHLGGRPIRHVDTDRYRQSYNVSPGSNLLVVRRDGGSDDSEAVVQSMKWGLLPSFTKKTDKPDHFKMFNARSESITEKASFRRLVPHSRCLVSVEGFYEWKKNGSKKQPYYIHFRDGRPLVFAALFDSWKNSEGDVLYTFTILTTSSSSSLAWLHDRMPVILGDGASSDQWLKGSSSFKIDALLKPYEESDLVWYPVTTDMGKASFDGPECIKEQIQLKTEEIKPISKFFAKMERKSSQELKPDVAMSQGFAAAQGNEAKGLKVEPETDEHPDHHSLIRKSDHEAKSGVTVVTCEGIKVSPVKRDYDEFSAGPNPSIDRTHDQHIASPTKKKGKGGKVDKQQPTLFSYFAKK